MSDGGTRITPPSGELVTTLHDRATLVKQLRDPEISLARAVATYLLYKRKRLSEDSQRGYSAILGLLVKTHSDLKLTDLEPPDGGLILEEFLESSTSTTTMGADANRPRAALTAGAMTQEGEAPMRDKHTLRGRLVSKTVRDGDCWIWQGFVNPKGYGKWQVPGYGQMAHRVSYQLFVGPIPEGMEIDHLCRNRSCVNPAHLEAVTHHENSMRGDTIPARHAAKTHCAKGHPLSGDNVRQDAKQRYCRACQRAAGARYRARKKAAA